MTLRLAVVHEAEADFRTATSLADRVPTEAIDWLEESLIPDAREWVDAAPVGCRLRWTELPELATKRGIKAHGHFDGRPGEPDAVAARRAIRYLKAVSTDFAAVLLVRDRDNQPERRNGLEQARGIHSEMVIVIGLAAVEREAWVLSGFEPQEEAEVRRLESERQRLAFDPCERSHLLTDHKADSAPRSPKRALRTLTDGDTERESRCWTTTPLSRLRERGTENGLAMFLDEVRTRLAPLFGNVTPGTR